MSRKHKRKKNYNYDAYYHKPPEKRDDFDLRFWRNILIFISLFVYLILFPPFLKNQALGGHDAGAHLTYLRIFTDAFSQGQFPVRWIEWVVPGQNQPLFSYYQPLLYYLGQIPRFLGLDILNSLYSTVLFMWLFSGLITYLFVKNITSNTLAGLSASCLYVFAPYHILDIFVRSAYPESIALAFAPGMFWAIERLITTEKRIYLSLLALFSAATFVSHPPTLLIFGVPLFFYICFLFYEKFKFEFKLKLLIKNTVLIFLGFALGGGLSAFFAIPALLQQGITKASTLNAGYLDFHKHFVCLSQLFWSNWDYGTSQPGCADQLSFQLGIVNWAVIVSIIAILVFYFYKKITHPAVKQTLFWLSIAFFGVYMTLSFSQPFWEGTPYLSFLQFPWRFLSIAIFAAAVLSGMLFMYLRKETYKIALFIIFIIAAPLLSYRYLQPAAYLAKAYFAQDSKDFYQGIAQGQLGGTALMGYFPKTMDVLPEQNKVPLDKIALSDPNAAKKVIKDTFIYKEFNISSKLPIKAELFIHYFPGWTFSINDTLVTPDTSNIYDFVYLSLPAGNNKIVAKFENIPLVTAANYISLLSILILIVFSAFELTKIIQAKTGLLKQSKTDGLIEEI
nr:hypothetical protein [Candidatus Levybacteria bacterium]